MKTSVVSQTYQKDYPKMEKMMNNNRLIKVIDIVKKYIPKNPQRILDVGCGNGYFAKKLGSITGASEIFGIDISKNAIKEANNLKISAKQIDTDQEKLPYKDNYFDFIFCGSVIELVLNPDRLISEIYRVLSPKGILIITYPNHSAWLSRLAVILGYNPYYDRLSTKYNLGKLFLPVKKGKEENSTGFIRLYSTRSFKEFVYIYDFEILHLFGAKGENLPGVAGILDNMFSNFPSLSFQNICVARKRVR